VLAIEAAQVWDERRSDEDQARDREVPAPEDEAA
jgi:hypothetical protein